MTRQATRTQLRKAAAPIWHTIYRHPFLAEVGRGILPREKFRFFITQDYLYLKEFTRVLCLGGAKARDLDTMNLFAQHPPPARRRPRREFGRARRCRPPLLLDLPGGGEAAPQANPEASPLRPLDPGLCQFRHLVNEQLSLVDRLGRDASPREREQMTNHFVTSSRYERLFWDQAYRLAEWPL